MTTKELLAHIPGIRHAESDCFFLLAGPCVIESEEMALRIAEKVCGITDRLGIPYVFKGSYKKANRSRIDSFTGIGDEKALKILDKVRRSFGVPVVTDIHESPDAQRAAEYVDVLQIPAFLVRQTDLVVAAARTGKPVNLKKRAVHGSRCDGVCCAEGARCRQSLCDGDRPGDDVRIPRPHRGFYRYSGDETLRSGW